MRRAPLTTLTCAAAVVAALTATLHVASAQRGAPAEAKASTPRPAPSMPDGHPDLSGVWWPGQDLQVRPLADTPRPAEPAAARGAVPAGPPRAARASFVDLYQPWAKEKAAKLADKDDPSLRCMPVAFGTLNISLYGLGFVGQIVQTAKQVILLTETFHSFKIIPTDGRPHRDDVAPSYRGDSVGHWEGDTLVVDSTNFTDANWIYAEGRVSFHSDALHIVERYRRADRDTLEIDATLEDPKVLTGPFVAPKQTLRLAPFDQIMEIGCSGIETAALMEGAAKINYGKK